MGDHGPRYRVHEIDLVRGLALFGILIVNMPYYGLPLEVAGGVPAPEDRLGLLVWSVISALFELKFVSLFSVLFGMSLALQRRSLLEGRGRWIAAILRRHTVLFLVGLIHGVALFSLDILLPY